jgi:hypothetical protein
MGTIPQWETENCPKSLEVHALSEWILQTMEGCFEVEAHDAWVA